MRTILFINWYNEQRTKRAKELLECLNRNIENKAISHIVNISDTPIENKRVINAHHEERLTFGVFFQAINATVDPEDISIIANLDIFFDETIEQAKRIKENECFALSRWEILPNGKKNEKQVQVLGDSQDVWIFKGKVRKLKKSDFYLGMLGCDNRIAHELKGAGYNVLNPSKTIKAWHLHNSNIRNYNEHDIIPPPYHRIKPHLL